MKKLLVLATICLLSAQLLAMELRGVVIANDGYHIVFRDQYGSVKVVECTLGSFRFSQGDPVLLTDDFGYAILVNLRTQASAKVYNP